MALAKQFEFHVTGRGVLTDPTLPATPTNTVYTIETVTINGSTYPASALDSTAVTNIQTNVETAVQKKYLTQQTVTITSASVANTQTIILTSGALSVTYTNSSGSAVEHTSGALATALKTVCDANTAWAARFNTTVSGDNLVVTQKGDTTKASLIVVTGTGTITATVA